MIRVSRLKKLRKELSRDYANLDNKNNKNSRNSRISICNQKSKYYLEKYHNRVLKPRKAVEDF